MASIKRAILPTGGRARLCLLLLCGCAPARYSITAPVQRAIEDRGMTVSMLPVIYQFVPTQEQLVVSVRNVSGETVRISAEVETADGVTHSLPGGTVGPAEALKLLLPPTFPPPIPAAGPVQFGVSDFAAAEHPGRFGASSAVAIRDDIPVADRWQWSGDLTLRVTVVSAEETVRQRLKLRRG